MAKKAKTDKQLLKLIMWNCRNVLRETTGGNENNRDAVMDLMFLKFGRDKFDQCCKEGFLK
jgi:type I restriction enzyme M protein